MPLHEYRCKKCGHTFERIQKFSDGPVKKCPQCGGALEQLLSAPAVQFKGSGWYVTDYARKSSGGSDSEHKSNEAPSESGEKSAKAEKDKSETKSETKPKTEPKTEPKKGKK